MEERKNQIIAEEFGQNNHDIVVVRIKHDDAFCACNMCQGKLMRKDIAHYKLENLATNTEYYLHIESNGNYELIERD